MKLKNLMQAAITLAALGVVLMTSFNTSMAYDNGLPLNPIIINPTVVGGKASNLSLSGTTSTNETLNSATLNSATLNNPSIGSVDTTAAWRVVNTTASVSAVTVASGIASTYIATPSSVAVALTLDVPQGDGERRRVCFGGAVTTVSWTVTAPATATAGLPTSATAGQCVETVYNAVSGVPANAAATTWYRY